MKRRIGIVGGGQLGRMIGLEAKRLGFRVSVIDPTPHSPASQVVDKQIVAKYEDEKAIRELAGDSDFLTFEIELANAKLLRELEGGGVSINPSPETLIMIKDKLKQSEFLKNLGIPVADFVSVNSKKDIENAALEFNYPILLKSRFDGYDGRGNALIKSEKDIDKGIDKLRDRKLYVEKFVPFVKELAVITARDIDGNITCYPVVETIQKNNICTEVYAPALIDERAAKKANSLAIKTMQHLKGAGAFGIEMFLTKTGEVMINEIAPRVHNSGHFTQDACFVSQFEQHVRAITGMPLGETDMLAKRAVMINILGDRNGKANLRGLGKALAVKKTAVHIYGKQETRIDRKMGHINSIGDTHDEALRRARKAASFIRI